VDPATLGPYKIDRVLGRGGMGVVYQATDPRLGRSVAIKVLPGTSDALALGRFLREAKTVAALQHPHIAVLHDVGREGDTSYLVMERLEGESLAAAIDRGALPWKDVVRIGEQIAGALEHAHGLGVLHRDIKPSNIMLAPGRGAVLLDFGVALRDKTWARDTEVPGRTETVERLTRAGTMIGTVAYMSPEQLQEQALDQRSDLFQLGATLHEAVTGTHPFGGPTNVDVMHAILRTAPRPLRELCRAPEELSRIVGKLLEKDPEYRYPDARALLVDLRSLERSSTASTAPTLAAPRRGRKLPWPALSAVLAALSLLAGLALGGRGHGASSAAPARLVPLSHGEGNDASPSFAPDGKSFVFASDRGGNWDLWVGLVNGDPPVRITETLENEGQPAWSPDGTRVAFRRARRGETASDVFVMPALGGHARRLAERALDPAWSPDGGWIVYADVAGGWARLVKARSDGSGAAVAVTAVEAGYFHRHPSWSPDGRTLVFNRSPGGLVGEILTVPSEGGTPRPITHDPDGTQNLSATFTPDGRYVVHASDRGGTLNLWRIPAVGGRPERITSGPGQDFDPQVSSDGKRIAFMLSLVATRILSVPLDGGEPRSLLSLSGSEAWGPDVSPDGSSVVFALKVPGNPWRLSVLPQPAGPMRPLLEGQPDIVCVRHAGTSGFLLFDSRGTAGGRIGRVRADGTGLQWLTEEGQDRTYPDLSEDGRLLAFVGTSGGRGDIVVRDVASGAERVVVENATLPRFSPDHRSLAFARSRAYAGVGVVALNGGEPIWLTSSGTWPTWMPDGASIAYADVGSAGGQVARVVPTQGGVARDLSSYRWRSTHFPFVVSSDGHSLLTTDTADNKSTLWLAEY
jgi:Tol biopolymer transport system component/serine/threonine protein kinase